MTYLSALSVGTKTVYRDENGKEWIRDGGSRSWRNFNPGNIANGSFADACGAIGGDTRFAVFPDEQTGLYAIDTLFKTMSYRNLTLEQAVIRYAPPNENDSAAYVKAVTSKTNCAASTVVNSLSAPQLQSLAEAIKQHEGWKPGNEYPAAGPLVRPAMLADMSVAQASELPGPTADNKYVSRLVALGSDIESLHRIQVTAAASMKAAGYGYTMHNACAATLSALLNAAGIAVPTTLGVGRLAERLRNDRKWARTSVGDQQAGDVGVAANDAHIYLVVEAKGADEMVIADNQKTSPHTRFASGKGRTPTAYFLRAPNEQGQPLMVALDSGADSSEQDDGFYPQGDEQTFHLMEPAASGSA